MRALVQRVKQASVSVEQSVVGSIEAGLLVFLGLKKGDSAAQIPWMINKLLGLRVFTDEAGKMNLSVQDVEGGLLIVSQFTLYGDCMSGRRPSFTEALSGEEAEALYDAFVARLKERYSPVQTGQFAASMEVALVNDGPVTLWIDDLKF